MSTTLSSNLMTICSPSHLLSTCLLSSIWSTSTFCIYFLFNICSILFRLFFHSFPFCFSQLFIFIFIFSEESNTFIILGASVVVSFLISSFFFFFWLCWFCRRRSFMNFWLNIILETVSFYLLEEGLSTAEELWPFILLPDYWLLPEIILYIF